MTTQSDKNPQAAEQLAPIEPQVNKELTAREIEILSLIFSGRGSKEVADALCVSKRTVDFHLGKAYAKLGVNNRVQAYKKAAELGLIS